MIGLSRRTRVFAYGAPCDMRKSFNTLSGLVAATGHEVATGDAFVFVGHRRKRAKVIWHDGTGLCLLAKRLDQGKFAPLWDDGGDKELELTTSELQLFLEGCEVVGRMPLSPPVMDMERASRIAPSAFG
jgi:transposase